MTGLGLKAGVTCHRSCMRNRVPNFLEHGEGAWIRAGLFCFHVFCYLILKKFLRLSQLLPGFYERKSLASCALQCLQAAEGCWVYVLVTPNSAFVTSHATTLRTLILIVLLWTLFLLYFPCCSQELILGNKQPAQVSWQNIKEANYHS